MFINYKWFIYVKSITLYVLSIYNKKKKNVLLRVLLYIWWVSGKVNCGRRDKLGKSKL